MTAEAASGELRDDEASAWVRGVDYVRAWVKARDAVEELNDAAVALGLHREDLRATPHTDSEGNGVVRLQGTPEGIRLVAQALRQARS